MSESNVFKTPDAQMRQNLKLDPMEENLVELGKFRTEILGLSHRRISLRGIKVQYLTDADRKLYEKLRTANKPIHRSNNRRQTDLGTFWQSQH